MKNKNNSVDKAQSGFAHPHLLFFVIVLAIIGFAGYHVYQTRQASDLKQLETQSQAASDKEDQADDAAINSAANQEETL